MDVVLPLIDIQIAHEHPHNPKEHDFKMWILQAINQLSMLTDINLSENLELCIRVVNREEMQQLNREFREQDKATNVLAFPFDSLPGWENDTQILGDIVICSSVVANEATEQNKPVADHWAHLTLHGFLHLLGYDHIEETDAQIMEDLEVRLLANLNIPNPYYSSATTLVH